MFSGAMRIVIFTLIGFILTSCASWNSDTIHRAKCRQLNSDIIFNGATPNTRKQEIQNAEAPLQQQNYDRDCES